MSARTHKILGFVGRTLVGLGLLVFAFAAFQVWGTGYSEHRAQQALTNDIEERLTLETLADTSTSDGALSESAAPVLVTEEPLTVEAPAPKPPAMEAALQPFTPVSGDALGVVKIPAINVEKVMIEGVSRDDLQQGPGHYPGTALPGNPGNSAIAGHRTTYGAPFADIDQLVPGDKIEVTTPQGSFEYEVLPQASDDGPDRGHFIVAPGDTHVVHDYGDSRLTLTACHPKYSAEQRIVVQAALVAAPDRFESAIAATTELEPTAPTPTDPTSTAGVGPAELPDESLLDENANRAAEDAFGLDDAFALDDALGWHRDEWPSVLAWAIVAGVVGLAAWLLGRVTRRWATYAASGPFMCASLWMCFTHLDRMLPAF